MCKIYNIRVYIAYSSCPEVQRFVVTIVFYSIDWVHTRMQVYCPKKHTKYEKDMLYPKLINKLSY